MRKVFSTQSNNNFLGIRGRSGVKGFLSIFGVGNIKFASPDDHNPKPDFVFSF